MKKIFLLIVFGLLVNSVFGQVPTDTVLKRTDTVLKRAEAIDKKVESLSKATDRIKDSVDKLIGTVASECKKCEGLDVKAWGWEWLLVFLPAIIFFVLFIIILAKGLRKFDLQGALTENDYTKITKVNDQYIKENIELLIKLNLSPLTPTPPPVADGAVPPPIPNPPAPITINYTPPDIASILPPTIDISNTETASSFRPSISRYIAFVTTILTLIVALCMSCFFIYHYIRTGCAPDLGALSTILIALGIGVAPYAFNKISTAINKSKPE